MRESLWRIAHEPVSARVIQLGEQTNVVPQLQEALEKSASLAVPAQQDEVICQPENTDQKSTLAGR